MVQVRARKRFGDIPLVRVERDRRGSDSIPFVRI